MERVNGRYVSHEEPAPTINDSFKNVRYIKLETVLLPFYHRIYQKLETRSRNREPVQKYKVSQKINLTDNLYTVLSNRRIYGHKL